MSKFRVQDKETGEWSTETYTEEQLISEHKGQEITVRSVQENGSEGEPYCFIPGESISGRKQHSPSKWESLDHSRHSMASAFYGVFLGWKDWKGRSTRREYWNCLLGYIGLCFILLAVYANIDYRGHYFWVYPCVIGILSISVYACAVRRLHDTGHSGWWIVFCVLGTILGQFVNGHYDKTIECILGVSSLIVFPASLCVGLIVMFANSQAGRNKYGISQKYPFSDEEVKEMKERRMSPAKYLPVHLMHNKTGAALKPGYPTPDGTDVKYCSKCGTKLAADAQFCSSCGNKLA